MPFIIPNATDINDTKFAALDQSEPDSLDFQILGDRSSGVLSGCLVTAVETAAGRVNVASGKVVVGGVIYTVNESTLDLPSMAGVGSTSYRFDVVLVRISSGAATLTAIPGPASNTNPTYPLTYDRVTGVANPSLHVNPSTDVVLAAVYRDKSTSIQLKHIVDKRVNVASTVIGRGSSVPTSDIGQDGDFYYKTTSAEGSSGVYVKRDGVWIELLLQSNSATINPIGAIIMWPGTTPPQPTSGWRECNGDTLPIASYGSLYSVLQTTYNIGGEPAGTFRIPNLNGKFIYGSSAPGSIGGSNQVSIEETNLPQHSHSLGNHYHNISNHSHDMSHRHAAGFGGQAEVKTSPNGGHSHTSSSYQGTVPNGIVTRLSDYINGDTVSGIGYLAGFSATNDGLIDGTLASQGGMQVHWSPTTSEQANHQHDINIYFAGGTSNAAAGSVSGVPEGSTVTGGGNGSKTPISILPPYTTMRWFIRVQ